MPDGPSAQYAVPRTLALAWGLAAAPQRGPKRELSLERIVEAAISIADAEGLAAVTMQRVAAAFDFSTMALYRYVATKDELHLLMLDAALDGGPAAAASDEWRDELRDFLRGVLESYRAHPWTLDIPLVPDIHLMPGQLRSADRALRAMRSLPAPDESKLAVLMLLAAFARGHAAVEREALVGIGLAPDARALVEEAVTPERFPDAARLVRSGAYFGDQTAAEAPAAGSEEDLEAILEFALEVLMSGLDAVLASAGHESAIAPPLDLTPQEAFGVAEAELREHIARRKALQQRVRELERGEDALRKARDRAKEAAKLHAKQQRATG